MTPLIFEDHREMSIWIKAHGALPTNLEVRIGERVILGGTPNQKSLVSS